MVAAKMVGLVVEDITATVAREWTGNASAVVVDVGRQLLRAVLAFETTVAGRRIPLRALVVHNVGDVTVIVALAVGGVVEHFGAARADVSFSVLEGAGLAGALVANRFQVTTAGQFHRTDARASLAVVVSTALEDPVRVALRLVAHLGADTTTSVALVNVLLELRPEAELWATGRDDNLDVANVARSVAAGIASRRQSTGGKGTVAQKPCKAWYGGSEGDVVAERLGTGRAEMGGTGGCEQGAGPEVAEWIGLVAAHDRHATKVKPRRRVVEDGVSTEESHDDEVLKLFAGNSELEVHTPKTKPSGINWAEKTEEVVDRDARVARP